MVVQTHHYQTPAYAIGSAASSLLGVAKIAAAFRVGDATASASLILMGLALLGLAVYLGLRYRNECIYFTPTHLVHIKWHGMARTRLSFEGPAMLVSMGGRSKDGLLYVLKSGDQSVIFDRSITDFEGLVGELCWKVAHAPMFVEAAYPPSGAVEH